MTEASFPGDIGDPPAPPTIGDLVGDGETGTITIGDLVGDGETGTITMTWPNPPPHRFSFDYDQGDEPWAGYDPVPQCGFPDEPAAHVAQDSVLLDMSDEEWDAAWKSHVKFRDGILRRCNHVRHENRFGTCDVAYAGERHIEAVHSKMRTIMLERSVRRLEKRVQALETVVAYAPGGRVAEAAKADFATKVWR
uniref:Uncharacterized protein n=1 Tax=Marseillevirus LCMAC103 TaxID=2506604 RepID=A0A481YUU3_9VIRU|nr:MAG: uncharacterized protein LCMAC103_02070 [Marseillevirus LCMAC103]